MKQASPKPGWHVDRTTYSEPDIYWVSQSGTRFELWEIEDRVRVNPLSSGERPWHDLADAVERGTS